MEREANAAEHARASGPAPGRDPGMPQPQRIRIEQHSAAGMLWFAAWLFTIGFLHLPFWKGVLALVLWPYYLGSSLGSPAP